ncbi:hypothetical protein ABB37_02100 [Leptomonas pyrrhocoris]|uniref:Uncharacterized protein n=1 Tax=Leptomonas pyrrhocoris TaxID=157538 RepID=A0A0M9G781_LEPPY|nr:hypothetical protein ABB37_02100 [Leptomonas pyrrhocoris]KPA83947.1 hypothetical protein ABB37_02100 [Leptomonas pyrrhocoris]|eukprot:XP_015662386.1 hypothetical protein ABB37_02100 [Leptomonas pyrrhocoris]
MEVIYGSIYVEIESVLGLFQGGTTGTTTVSRAAAGAAEPRQKGTAGNSVSDSNDAIFFSTPPTSEVKEDKRGSLPQREVSSHSPFGTALSSSYAFSEQPTHIGGTRDAAQVSAFGNTKNGAAKHREAPPSGVHNSGFALPVITVPCPPPLTVRFGEVTHLIDTQSAAATSAASVGGLMSSLSSSGLGPKFFSPTTGCAATSAHLNGSSPSSVGGRVEGPTPLLRLPRHGSSKSNGSSNNSGSGSLGVPHGMHASNRKSKNPSTGSSQDSLLSAAAAAWETVLDIVDNSTESEDGDGDGGSPVTPPRSFHWDSASSATENDEVHHTAGSADRLSPTNADARPGRLPMLPSPEYPTTATADKGVAPRQGTLLWLADHVRNDPSVLSAITWVGPRPQPGLDAAAPGSAVAASAFASAWYARLFPDVEDEHNVLSGDVQALQSAWRSLRRWSPRLTAAVFPLHQRFSIVKTAIEVRSSVAFDLLEAMRQRAPRETGSHPDDSDAEVGAGYLAVRLATPAELKKARHAAHKSLVGSHKKTKEADSFFAQIHRSLFTGHRSKEDRRSNTEIRRGSAAGCSSRGLSRASPTSPSHHQPAPSLLPDIPTPSSASSAAQAAHTSITSQRRSRLEAGSFAIRLHLSRLLSPLIFDWMKGHRTVEAQKTEGEESSGDSEAARASGGDDTRNSVHHTAHADSGRTAVFCRSLYLPLPLLPPPSEEVREEEDGSCVAMMLKVSVLFRPGVDAAELF